MTRTLEKTMCQAKPLFPFSYRVFLYFAWQNLIQDNKRYFIYNSVVYRLPIHQLHGTHSDTNSD